MLETWNEISFILRNHVWNQFIHSCNKTIRLVMQLLKWTFLHKTIGNENLVSKNFDFIILKHGVKFYAIISFSKTFSNIYYSHYSITCTSYPWLIFVIFLMYRLITHFLWVWGKLISFIWPTFFRFIKCEWFIHISE